jgi:hypothetical protein
MASLEVSALAGAAAAWLPIGVAGCAPGYYPAASQVPSGPASPVRSRAPPSAIPAGSPPTQSAGGPVPRGFAATSCLIKPLRAEGGGEAPLSHRRRKDGMR